MYQQTISTIRSIALITTLAIVISAPGAEKVTYLSLEHPQITTCNPAYITDCKVTARRFGRVSPVYYVDASGNAKDYFSNNFTVDFYFYEFLTNQYKRSFVEMHFKLCDLIHKDPFFGAALKQGKLLKPCPYPPGFYEMVNMTVLPSAIPRGFPFAKGRIYIEIKTNNIMAASGHIDMEIRQLDVKDKDKVMKKL